MSIALVDVNNFYASAERVGLPTATNDTRVLVSAVIACLHRIYRDGYRYIKAGVMLTDISAEGVVQGDLFSEPSHAPTSQKLMTTLDLINRKMGKGAIKLASDGIAHGWKMKIGNKSQSFTTNWEELPVVR